MGYSEFGKYLTNYRIRNNMVLGDMAKKIQMKTTRLSDIQVGARITDEEFKVLIKKYRDIRLDMEMIYHTVGLDRYNESRVRNGKYFAYRNYFAVSDSSRDFDVLKNLEKSGYMQHTKLEDMCYFHMTEKGYKLIEDITGLKIIEGE